MRFLHPLVWLIALLSATARGDTYPRQAGIDVVHYAFGLSFADETDEIAGNALIDVRFVRDGVAEFALDLTSTANGTGMVVSAVSAGDRGVPFRHDSDRLTLSVTPAARSGDVRSFRVQYAGIPAGGLRIGPNRYGDRTYFSDNWPNKIHHWLPVIDHPHDKATSEFLITAPAHYQVVASGLLQEETDLGNGRRLTRWRQSVPIASWLNALAIAPFSARHAGEIQGVPFQSWVFLQDRDASADRFERPMRQAVNFFSQYVGPYPYEKVGMVEAPGIEGGMELASAIFFGEIAFHGRDVASLVAHEVAHQWFGDSVTEADWDDVWLSEGFATYFALLYTEADAGRGAFVEGLKRSRSLVQSAEATNPDRPVIHRNLSDPARVLNPLVYQKGAWTLHMLRGLIGDEAFRKGIRAYYQRFRDRNARTDDFRRIMELQSGRELSWFFTQWLNRPGSPTVSGTWRYDPTKQAVVVDLFQEQGSTPYRLALEIGISSPRSDVITVAKVEMTERRQRFELAQEQAPSAVVLDPNTWVLMTSRFQRSQ
jgi:aminopeptidase N